MCKYANMQYADGFYNSVNFWIFDDWKLSNRECPVGCRNKFCMTAFVNYALKPFFHHFFQGKHFITQLGG